MNRSTNNHSAIRALIIAEHCHPDWTSVPLVSWHYVASMRERIPIHLVTQVRNRDALVKHGMIEGRDFTAIDSERIARPLWRVGSILRGGQGKGWTTVMALNAFSYYYFEHLLWEQFGQAIQRREYDIVHRLTPLSPTIPSLIAGRCAQAGVPFVLGPMNGGLPWPKQFRAVQAREREWLSTVRDLCRFMPYWRSTYQHAAVVISGSRDTRRQLEPITRRAHISMPRNGVDVTQFELTRRPGYENPSRPLHLLFVGRLVPYKGCDMVLEAAAPLLRNNAARFTIAGEGPQRPALEAMVERHAIPGVRFLGDVPHEQLQRCFAEADVLTFPSIREFGGAVVLESMSCGVPVIVVDYGGPGELASNECGTLIPLGSRDEIVQALHRALNELDADRPRLARMGAAARRRAEQMFDWTVKAKQLIDIYEWALGRRSQPEIMSADSPSRIRQDRSRKVEQLA